VNRHLQRILILLAFGLSAGWALPAQAALGGGTDSVVADAAALHGASAVTALQTYDIFEIAAGDGARIREYATHAGVVFAVAWSGPVMPDLHILLGDNFAAYAGALATVDRPGLRRSLRLETAGLVVETGGHMRAYRGRAYLANRLPAGAAVSDLR